MLQTFRNHHQFTTSLDLMTCRTNVRDTAVPGFHSGTANRNHVLVSNTLPCVIDLEIERRLRKVRLWPVVSDVGFDGTNMHDISDLSL